MAYHVTANNAVNCEWIVQHVAFCKSYNNNYWQH